MDTPSKIFVWMGADTSAALRQLALDITTTAANVRLKTARARSKRSKNGSLKDQPLPEEMVEDGRVAQLAVVRPVELGQLAAEAPPPRVKLVEVVAGAVELV